jgi:site-specific recombinase XerD
MKKLKVRFLTNPSRTNKEGLTPLELILSLDGKHSSIRTGKFIKPNLWDSSKQKVKGNKEINDFMEALKNKVFGIETSILKADLPLTLEVIKDKLNDREISNTLIGLINKFDNDLCKQVANNTLTESTYLKYRQNEKHIRAYLKSIGKNDLNVDLINGDFINSYFNYLLTTCKNNTAVGIVGKLKRIIGYGLSFGYIKTDPFQFVSFRKEKSETIQYLTEVEVNKIALLEIEDKELNQIRDIFIFCCLTSLSYIDCVRLRKKHIFTGLKGRWIVINRQKNGNEQRIPLLLTAERILEKYNYVLPVPSNQKYNKRLKEIAQMAGIEMELHSHVARHTSATLLLNNNISIEAVAKILGHSSTVMTNHYAKMLDETVFEQVNTNFQYKFQVV